MSSAQLHCRLPVIFPHAPVPLTWSTFALLTLQVQFQSRSRAASSVRQPPPNLPTQQEMRYPEDTHGQDYRPAIDGSYEQPQPQPQQQQQQQQSSYNFQPQQPSEFLGGLVGVGVVLVVCAGARVSSPALCSRGNRPGISPLTHAQTHPLPYHIRHEQRCPTPRPRCVGPSRARCPCLVKIRPLICSASCRASWRGMI